MHRILKRHPFTSVAQLAHQLSKHGVYVTKPGAQYWMNWIALGVTLMTNQVETGPIFGELDP